VGRPRLERQAYQDVGLAGRNIVSELGRQLAVAESLATVLADLGEQLPRDDTLTRSVVQHLLEGTGSQTIIAGGPLAGILRLRSGDRAARFLLRPRRQWRTTLLRELQ
jgi:hypothetical protein